MQWIKGNERIDGKHLIWKDEAGNEFETWNPTEDFLIEQGWVKEKEEVEQEKSLKEVKESVLNECNEYYRSVILQVEFENQITWIPLELRTAYRSVLEDLKSVGKTEVNWRDEDILIDTAIGYIKKVNLYEYECKKIHNSHLRNISKLQTVKELEEYDYSANYPPTLSL